MASFCLLCLKNQILILYHRSLLKKISFTVLQILLFEFIIIIIILICFIFCLCFSFLQQKYIKNTPAQSVIQKLKIAALQYNVTFAINGCIRRPQIQVITNMKNFKKKSPAMVLPSTKSPPSQSIKLKKIDQEPKES